SDARRAGSEKVARVGNGSEDAATRIKLRVGGNWIVRIDHDLVSAPRASRDGARVNRIPARAVRVADLREPSALERPFQRSGGAPGVSPALICEYDGVDHVSVKLVVVRGPPGTTIRASKHRLWRRQIRVDIGDPVPVPPRICVFCLPPTS